MNKIKILTDSTCDLPVEVLKQNDVEVLPLGVNFGEEAYKDGVDINVEQLYKMVDEKGQTPKTSAIPPVTFDETFKKYKDEGYDILYTGIGSKISSTYQAASIVAQKYEGVYVIDSLNLSSAIGLQVLKMCKMRDEGKSAKEIADIMPEIVKKTKCSFIIDTLEYLRKGGRCSGMTAFVGKVLSIKPTIIMKEGELKVGRIHTNLQKGCDSMIAEFKKKYESGIIDPDHVMVTHSMSFEMCDYTTAKLAEFCPKEMIMPTNAGCVISSHCGPKCIGILYIEK